MHSSSAGSTSQPSSAQSCHAAARWTSPDSHQGICVCIRAATKSTTAGVYLDACIHACLFSSLGGLINKYSFICRKKMSPSSCQHRVTLSSLHMSMRCIPPTTTTTHTHTQVHLQDYSKFHLHFQVAGDEAEAPKSSDTLGELVLVKSPHCYGFRHIKCPVCWRKFSNALEWQKHK